MTRPRKNPGASGIRTRDLPLSRRMPLRLGQWGGLVGRREGWGGGGGELKDYCSLLDPCLRSLATCLQTCSSHAHWADCLPKAVLYACDIYHRLADSWIIWTLCVRLPLHFKTHRLVGLVVKASAWRAEDPGFECHLQGDFSRSSHTSDLKIGTPVATLPGAWRYRISAGIGQPSVSILWVGEVESLICSFYLSVAARILVWVDPPLRYTSMLLGC